MAIRLHLTALRQAEIARIREVFSQILGPSFAEIEIHEQNGWKWFTTSVWGVRGSDLHRGLQELGVPGLNITTADASYWYLDLFGNDLEPQHFLHDFSYLASDATEWTEPDEEESEPVDPDLAFLEDDPLPPGPPRIPFDSVIDHYDGSNYKSMAEPFRPQAEGLSIAEAFPRFVRWHAEQVADALAARGFAFDRARLTAVLRQEDPYDRRFDGDLGNLPWFAVELGLGGQWDEVVHNWTEQVNAPPVCESTEEESWPEEEEEEVDTKEQARDNEYLDELRQLPVTAIENGPVLVPVTAVADVIFFAFAAAGQDAPLHAWILADFPLTSTTPYSPPPKVRGEPEQVRIDFAEGHLVGHVLQPEGWVDEDIGNIEQTSRFIQLLRHLPEGTRLECVAGSRRFPASRQRFIGTVTEGGWAIDASHPPLSAATLSAASKLLKVRDKETVACHDEAEAEALMAAVRIDGFLHSMEVERKGKKLRCEFGMWYLVRLLFQQRFADTWDFSAARAQADSDYQERLKAERRQRRQMVELAHQMAAPHEQSILYKGLTTFWASDLGQFDHLNEELTKRIEAGVTELGLRHLGDMVFKLQRNDIRRIWISPDRLSYAVVMANRFGYCGFDFYSQFADGSSLTTTTTGGDSKPAAGVYYKNVDWTTIPEHYARHRWGLERFRQNKQTEPVPLPDSLLGAAQTFDNFLIRYGPLPQIEVTVEEIPLEEK